jgi:serine/threonine protein kinase
MSIPVTSAQAQAQATALQILQKQSTQYDNKPYKNIKILTVVKQTIPEANEEHNQCSLFFHNAITATKISIANEKATMENYEEASQEGIQLSKKLLGSGSFGKVSKGLLQNEHGQIDVAIKKLHFGFNVTRDFHSEINALYTLKNEDNIITILFALHDPSGVYNHIVMECGDMDLGHYLEFIKTHSDIEINNKQLSKIGYDIFTALLSCLNHGVLNTDIKLDNYIIFFDQNIIKLADFGVLSTNRQDGSIQVRMTRQTAKCFVECSLNRITTDNKATRKTLYLISSRGKTGASISNEDKTYFNEKMLPFVDNNPLLLKLTQGVFSDKDHPLDVAKTTTDIKHEVELQALTDVRHML